MDRTEAYRAAGEIFGYLVRDNNGELFLAVNNVLIVFHKEVKIGDRRVHMSYAISLSELSLLRDKIYREEMAKSITDKWYKGLQKVLSST